MLETEQTWLVLQGKYTKKQMVGLKLLIVGLKKFI